MAAPDLGRDLANLDGGGLRESLSDIPNFVGDGCAPTANASRAAIGRVGIIAQDMYMTNAEGQQSLFGTKQPQVYQFPGNLQTIAALQAAVVTGVPAGSRRSASSSIRRFFTCHSPVDTGSTRTIAAG